MPILPMVSATKTLDKVLCLAADIKHSSFENGRYSICNDTVDHVRTDENGNQITYISCPFSFNLPSQSETDNSGFGVTNINLISSNILKVADNSFEDIIIQCWLVLADYDGSSNWIDLGEYIWDTEQNENAEFVSGALVMKNCYDINAGRFRGKNPSIFINLNHR